MSKQLPRIKILVILVLLLQGCASQTPPPEIVPSAIPANEQIVVLSPDASTPHPIPTTVSAIGGIDCQNYSIDSQNVGSGFLIVKDSVGNSYVVDLQSMESGVFVSEPTQFIFSIDAQAFAYTTVNETDRVLKIQTAGATIEVPWQDNWYSLARWLDGEHIQINESNNPVSAQIIFNPFENTSKRIVPEFSDIYNTDSKINWDGLSLVSYSSNLRFAVYPRLRDDLALVLIPTYEDGVVARLSPIDINSYPQWSPYGTFVIGGPSRIDKNGQLMGYDLYQIGLSGHVEQITEFSEMYEYPLIRNYRWSTNYDDISFWFSNDTRGRNSAYLGFTNVTSKVTTLTCIKADNIEFTIPPVWSPDGKLLAVTVTLNEGKTTLVLIDPSNSKFRILDFGNALIPIGWVSFKP